MAALYSDTHPKIEAMQIRLIQQMPIWEKFSVVDSLNETVRVLAISGIKAHHPDATPEQVRRLLAETMFGVQWARKVYDHAR
ncbi:MAG: hypothetical protein C4326_14490 [Ignavibacteria bacterium]